MIAALVVFGGEDLPRLAVLLAWGSVAGSALQLLVQLPAVLRVAPDVLTGLSLGSRQVRTVVTNFVPVFVSRGVLQLSAYIDAVLASLLPTGAVTGLATAQGVYLLPVSLFGMSVAAAELPAMSGDAAASGQGYDALRSRVDRGLRQVAFFIVPSAIAFFAFGDVIVAALFQTGRFRYEDAVYVWAVLAGSAVGLLPSTLGRLYSSTFYALKDTRTPLRYALVHVALATVLGYALAIPAPGLLGVPAVWGAVGLTFSAGLAGWVEMRMLRRSLNRRIGRTGLPLAYLAKLTVGAGTGAVAGWGIKAALPALHPALIAIVVLGPYGLIYFAVMWAFGVPEMRSLLRRRL
jgi:putative peptidoglycan lipid II flippase